MRAALAVLALLLVAGSASAKTLVVRPITSVANAKSNLQQFEAFAGMMRLRGGTFTDIDASLTRTLWMQTGRQVWGTFNAPNAVTEQFDAVVILFNKGDTFPAGASPCSLTLVSTWPSVPVVFLGPPAGTGGKWTSSSTCSTGVKSQGGAYSLVCQNYVAYPVGTAAPWKQLAGSLWATVALGSYPAGTTFRPLVALNYSATVPGGAPTGNSLFRTDADSTGYTAAGNDSLVMWVRTMTPTAAIPNPRPLIFVDPGTSSPGDLGLMAMAMQMADSASGGKVWDANGAKPIQAGFIVSAVTSRGKYTNDLSSATGTHLRGGTFCYADSCDSSNVLAGLDSLATLKGLKTTFYVDPCSLASYPSVKSWLARAGSYRVGIQAAAGTEAGAQAGADSTAPYDPLGRQRLRYAAQSSGKCSLVSDSALISCNVRRGFNLIANYFGRDLIDHSVLPAYSDWSPVASTRTAAGPGRDSVAWALYKAGVKTIIIRPEFLNTNPNISAYSPTATGATFLTGPTAPAADPWGYGPDAEVLSIYADPANPGRVIGRFKIIAERGEDAGKNVAPGLIFHDHELEFMNGLVSNWYFAPIRYYYHSFFTRSQILHASLGFLGGTGTATSARKTWWVIKHVHNQFIAANNLGWVDPVSGLQRKMFEWKFVEDLEP